MQEPPSLASTDLFYRSHEEIRALQNQRFRHQIALCFRAHPYYQEVFTRLKLTPEDFQTVEDVRKLPVTTKQDLLRNPEAFRLTPLPAFLPQERILWDVSYTTGTTTGIPAPFFNTTHDFFANLESLQRLCALVGITANDTVINLFPLTLFPHLSFRYICNIMTIGASVVSPFTDTSTLTSSAQRSLDEAVHMVERHKGTVLCGIASYVRRLLMRAEELGADFSQVRLVLVVGEPCPAGTREEMRRRLLRLGARKDDLAIKSGLGSTELQCATGECVELGGSHHPAPDQSYLEVLDEQSHIPLPDGTPGLLTITHLDRRGTVLLRYATGDLTAISHQVCPHCGRQGPRIVTNTVRIFERVMFNGTSIHPDVIKEAIATVEGVEEYQIVFTRQPGGDPSSPDTLLVRIAAQEVEQDRIRTELATAVTAAASIHPSIEFVSGDNELFDPEKALKSTRVVDLRPTDERGSRS
jgi:phenylacetate-CoA ligase